MAFHQPGSVGAHGPLRPQKFFLEPKQPQTPAIFDGGDNWWGDVQWQFTAIVLASTFAWSVQAALAQYAANQPQDEPALTAGYVDEQTWSNQVAPYVAPSIVPASWQADEQTPFLHGIYEDNEFWLQLVQPYVAPTIVPWAWQADEETPGLFGISDSNEIWLNQVQPFVASNFLPSTWAFEGLEIVTPPVPFHPEDDFWLQLVWPYVAPNLAPWPWQWDEQSPVLIAPPPPPVIDPCILNPMPLPNGMGRFTGISNDKLRHIPTGNQVLIRSDYACWCCALNRFVPKSEVGIDMIGLTEIFRGVF
jgi:hypothetical protein